MVRGEVGGTEATVLGRGAGGQRAALGRAKASPWCERVRTSLQSWSQSAQRCTGDVGWGWGEGLWVWAGFSPPSFFFLLENKSALPSLSFFPHLLFKFIWENLPECSHRCHQPDSLCRSNKMAL